MMPTFRPSLKAVAVAALAVAAGAVCAADEVVHWYNGQSTGFWGLNNSIGFRGALPGMFGIPGSNSPEGLSAQKQYGGYRLSETFAIEGAQTSFGLNGSACSGDPLTAEAFRSCYGAAWSLSGVATLPFESGLSFYGRLGLHYWQKGAQEETINRRSLNDLGQVLGIGFSYELSKSVTFHAESERYTDLSGRNDTGPGSNLGLDASVHSIGLSIRF